MPDAQIAVGHCYADSVPLPVPGTSTGRGRVTVLAGDSETSSKYASGFNVTPPEEVTHDELQHSFLKISGGQVPKRKPAALTSRFALKKTLPQ
jgi:hypothetical protein